MSRRQTRSHTRASVAAISVSLALVACGPVAVVTFVHAEGGSTPSVKGGNPAPTPDPPSARVDPTGIWVIRRKEPLERRPESAASFGFQVGDLLRFVRTGDTWEAFGITRKSTGNEMLLGASELERTFRTQLADYENRTTEGSVEFTFRYEAGMSTDWPTRLHYGLRMSTAAGDLFTGFETEIIDGVRQTSVIDCQRVEAFVATPEKISISRGEEQKLSLRAGVAQARRRYWILGSLEGTSPGFTLGPFTIPLVPDAYTQLTLSSSGSTILPLRGVLDAEGNADVQLNAGSIPVSAVGVILHHAYVILDPGNQITFASNPVSVELLD